MKSMQAMRTSLAVRLTEKQRSLVALAARQQGVAKGEIVRQALESFFANTRKAVPNTRQVQKTTAMVCKVLQQRLLQEVIHEIKEIQQKENCKLQKTSHSRP